MPAVNEREFGERLVRATAPCVGVEGLARAVFGALSAQVPFAFACLATTDPATGLITRAFKSHPLPIGDEDFAAAEYGEPDINQFAEIGRRPVPVGVLSIDTGGELERCRRFREFMAPAFGFTDELRLACRARNTTWGALALYRGPGEESFTGRDADLLVSVHEVLADALRRTLFAGRPADTGAGHDAAVLIVDAEDRVTDLTAAAQDRIDDLGGWDNGSLPPNVLAVVVLARNTAQPATTQVLGRSGRWSTLRAMPLDSPTTNGSVVVTVDTAARTVVGRMKLAARGLTTREQDIAQHVLHGASTTSIATSLHLSPHTVQDHLKSVFHKLGVNSRREMIAQLVLGDADSSGRR